MADADADKSMVKAGGMDAVTIFHQLGLLVGIAASVAITVWVVLWMQEPNYAILFGNLEKSEAGEVLDALQRLNMPYKLDESTGAILVPSKKVHDARIKLAAQGLPKSAGGEGFARLVTMDNTFGISESKENLIYQKALEQELARTISSLANVKSARIHLAIPKQSAFLRARQHPRASVTVSLYAGRTLNEGQVAAISHLVSSSVPNLDVEAVTVVDQTGHLLTNGQPTSEMAMTGTQFEYARKLEKSYIERIENILVPILGADSVRAQVTADIDFTYNEQTQELFNPESQVPVSVQIAEEQTQARGPGGVPGALSNLPLAATGTPGKSGAEISPGAASPALRSSRKEIRNYEIDKTVSHTRYAMGRVRRLSAAVVVDDKITANVEGERLRANRSPEEIDRITELVKKAIGFNAQRGDSVNVINEEFTQPAEPEELPVQPLLEQSWVWDVIKTAGGIAVMLILFGVLRPVIRNLARSMEPLYKAPAVPASRFPALAEMRDDQLSLSGGESQKRLEGSATPLDKNMAIAKQAVTDDPKLVAQVVKNWVAKE